MRRALEKGALDYTDSRPAGRSCFLHLGRDCRKIMWQASNSEAGLFQHIMQPGQTYGGLESILRVGPLFVNGGEERRGDVGQPGRCGRGGGRGSLNAVQCYLCFRARCLRKT